MQRDDSTERVDRPNDPVPRDRDALRRSLDAAWSRLIRTDKTDGDTAPPPDAADPNRGEESAPPRPDSSSMHFW